MEDYLNERLEFDQEGNLIMTTRDRIATGSVTYKTIGWTIKRYDGGIFEAWNQCAYISLTSLAQITDPEDSRYCYTTFYCDKNTIFNAIGKVSSDWQETLYREGGTVYLDAIMTVCHNGVPLGSLTDNPPEYTGQVYFYYDDIVNAQNWSNPASLQSHYNKSLSFPANPALLKETTYEIKHMEIAADNRMLPLSRYGKDVGGKLKNWASHAFPYSDFSSHYYRFDHSLVRITYYDGHYDELAYTFASAVTVANPTGLISHITVTYYYRRITQNEYVEQRYLLTEQGKLDTKAAASVTSSERNLEGNTENYDVLKGIPAGAYIDLSAHLSPYAYKARFQHCYGEFTCFVPVYTTYRLIWSDSSGNHDETVTLNETYYVDRKFSFYCLADYTIYTLQSVTFIQSALERVFQTVSETNPVVCDIKRDADATRHYTLPTATPLTFDGGTLTGNGSRPSLPSNAMQEKAEEAIGSIQVKNDRFQIGTALLLDDTMTDVETAAPVTPSYDAFTTLEMKDCPIPETRRNSSLYTTTCTAQYKSTASDASLTKLFNGNNIVVHTPVLCDAQISDDKKYNQQKTPDESRASLILGRTFTLRTACEGTHSSLPGYGKRNYSEYVKEIQVCFPFPVYSGDTLLAEHIWHTVSAEEVFYLPTGVSEDLYDIKVRVLAKNTPTQMNTTSPEAEETYLETLCQEGANVDRAYTIATRTLPVCVTGRLYGFSFLKENTVYQVGIKDKDGILNGNSLSKSFPVTGCSFYTELPFLLKTIGTPPSQNDYMELRPAFYHVDEKGQNRKPVDLYVLAKDDTLKKYDATLTLSAQSALFSGSIKNNVSDSDAAIKSVQIWKGSFQLPEPLLIVPAKTTLSDELEEKGSLSLKDSCFLQDGFLLVNFSITYRRSSLPALSYINRINAGHGYCNMWKMEGFPYNRMDSNRNTWTFTDGDTLLFSLKKEYKVYTTY